MLPSVDPVTLSEHSKFNALYQDLCTNKLNPDGTSRIQDAKVLKEREAFAEDLRNARVEVARRELVASGLRELSFDADELPEDLRELVAVIAAVLEGQVPEEDRDLLHDDISKFKANIDPIAQGLSKRFAQDIASISTILDPDDPPSAAELTASITALQTRISHAEDRLNTSRLHLATEAATVHALNRQAIQLCIALLEQSIHGAVARGSKARADYLAVVAEGMSKKLALQQHQLHSQLYSAEVREVLRARSEEMEVKSRAVRRQVREAEERLEGYRAARGMEGLAGEYAEVVAERERVRGEIERLEGTGGG